MNRLEALKTIRKSGSEPFHVNGQNLQNSLLDFWQWSSSEIVGNALRGMLAEYIVTSALGCADGVRTEWDAYDVLTAEGIKVEVKSGAYLQSWNQKKLSSISFGIRPTYGWDEKANEFATKNFRQADVYVFCLLNHEDKTTVDPLNLAQWDFFVVPTNELNKQLGSQKTMSLSTLESLNPEMVEYEKIADAVRRMAKRNQAQGNHE